jgi:hypothetical protein
VSPAARYSGALLVRCAARALGWLALLVATVRGVAHVDGGAAPALGATCLVLGPLAVAFAVQRVLTLERRSGALTGWQTLGVRPGALALPLLLLASPGLAGLLPAPAENAVLGLPAPLVDATVTLDAGGAWVAVPAPWLRPAAELGIGALLDRAALPHPIGARVGVDRAELGRRLATVLVWLAAVGLGVRFGLGASVRGRAPPAMAATLAIAGCWLAVLAGVAAAAA